MPAPTPAPTPLTHWLRPAQVVARPIGMRCNLKCRHCADVARATALFPASALALMNEVTLERFVRGALEAEAGDEVTFVWRGGEPALAGLEFFRRAHRWQARHAAGRTIHNTIHTNGTLLDEPWGDFLAEHGWHVCLSLDGPRALHDAVRVDAHGRSRWTQTMHGLAVLRARRVSCSTFTVVHRGNAAHPREVYEFLRGESPAYLEFAPLLERKATPADAARGLPRSGPPTAGERLVPRAWAGDSMAPESVEAEAWGEFLGTVFDTWVKRDVGRVFVQVIDAALGAWLGLGGRECALQEKCGTAPAVEPNGDVFGCDRRVYPEHRLGNLNVARLADLGRGAAEQQGGAKQRLPRVCLECPVKFVCNGDCPNHRFIAAGEGEPGVSYLCPGYKAFFTRIRPTMERMAALVRIGRPPADVMRRW